MIDEVTQRYVGRLREGELGGVPCDEGTVDEVERGLGVKLPGAYRAFLILAGGGWAVLEGSLYAVEDGLGELQRVGKEIARRAKTLLPEDAFVFLVHQGFACQFFLLGDGEDPAVYECVEGVEGNRRVAGNFSEWVLGAVQSAGGEMAVRIKVVEAIVGFEDWARPWTFSAVVRAGLRGESKALFEEMWKAAQDEVHWTQGDLVSSAERTAVALLSQYGFLDEGGAGALVRAASYQWR